MRSLQVKRLLLAGTAVTIAVLSLLPDVQSPPLRVPYLDKIEHMVAYLFLAFLAVGSCIGRRVWIIFWSILGVALFGGVLELLQGFTGRTVEAADFLCNCAGAVIGGFVGGFVKKSGSGM